MKLRTSGSLPLSKAISGFLQYKAAEGQSPNTISSYEHDLKLWLEFTADQLVHWIKTQQLNEYFIWLRTTYVPRQITGHHQFWYEPPKPAAAESYAAPDQPP